MDWSSAGPLWQRQSAGESRWARTEAVGEGRATSPTSLQPRVTQMYELLMQLAGEGSGPPISILSYGDGNVSTAVSGARGGRRWAS